jgi:hypothetical protein
MKLKSIKIQMNKLIISLAAILAFASCKGPGRGPLVKDSFSKPETEKSQAMNPHSNGSKVAMEKINVTIEPCKDCVKISDLLANKKSYSGKTVRVTGQVTKFNPEIMGKNWIHIQDGSEFEGAFDLTITTDQLVHVGETITYEGKIILDKDFGYGYFYAVLMEEGKPAI